MIVDEKQLSFSYPSCINFLQRTYKLLLIGLRSLNNIVKIYAFIGNNPIENLINPYPAIFNKIAAKRTDPAVGAST